MSRCALFAVIKCRILCRIPFSFRFYCSGRNDYYKTNITRALWLELVGNTQIKQLYTVETFIAIANTIKDKMTALFLIYILQQGTCKTLYDGSVFMISLFFSEDSYIRKEALS